MKDLDCLRTYAHSRGDDVAQWQLLQDHCNAVAVLCAEFAGTFGSGDIGRLAGELHDLGRVRSSFQSYLLRSNGIEDEDLDYGDHSHSGAGACWLWGNAGGIGKALAYCVAGHHAGLPDWSGGETPDGALVQRLRMKEPFSMNRPYVIGLSHKRLSGFLANSCRR